LYWLLLSLTDIDAALSKRIIKAAPHKEAAIGIHIKSRKRRAHLRIVAAAALVAAAVNAAATASWAPMRPATSVLAETANTAGSRATMRNAYSPSDLPITETNFYSSVP
jgi:hypothetical protein